MNKINICHIASGDLWYGAEIQIYNIIKGTLKNKKVNVFAVILNNNVLYQKLVEIGIDVYLVDESKINIFAQIFNVIKFIKASNINIIHTHRYKEDILGALAKLFLRKNIKLLRTQHGSFEVVPHISKRRSYLYWFLDLIFTKFFFDLAVGVSNDISMQFKKYLNPQRVRTIHNSIDTNNYLIKNKNQNFLNTKQTLKLAIIGRLVKVKKIDDFLQIICELDKTNFIIQAYIVGDGPEEYYLKKLTSDLKLSEVVNFTGRVEDISTIMNEIDILFITSIHEGIPTVLLEAMYFKKIILSKNVGGISEIMEDKNTGLFFNTIDEAVKLVTEIICRPEHFFMLADNAKQNVEKKYTHIIQSENYIYEYFQMCQKI